MKASASNHVVKTSNYQLLHLTVINHLKCVGHGNELCIRITKISRKTYKQVMHYCANNKHAFTTAIYILYVVIPCFMVFPPFPFVLISETETLFNLVYLCKREPYRLQS